MIKLTQETYTALEVRGLLIQQQEDLKETAKEWVLEQAELLAPKLAKSQAIVLADEYRELTPRLKDLENDKKELQFYIDDWAIPEDMTLGKMVMCRQLGKELWLSLIQTMNWIAFIHWKPAIYWETYLSLITKNKYKINVISESVEKVEVELDWPNWKQKGSFTQKEAETAWLWKGVYLKYPARMLRYRAIRNAQNVLCPEIMWGAYLVDEAEEIYHGKNLEKNVSNEVSQENVNNIAAELEARILWIDPGKEWWDVWVEAEVETENWEIKNIKVL